MKGESKKAVAKREAAINKKARLPVPAPKHPELSAAALPDDGLTLPDSLRVENRAPLTAEQKAAVDSAMAKAKEVDGREKSRQLQAAQKANAAERAKAKAAARKEKRKAAEKGETTAMPLSGKAALRKIAEAAVENGAKVTKVSAKANGKATRKSAPAKSGNGKSKVELIADLLRRKNGCTTADVLAATGWPSVSMPQQAKAAGLKLIKRKDGKVTRYFAG